MGTAERGDIAGEDDVPGVGAYNVEKATRAMETGSSKVVRGVSMASRPVDTEAGREGDVDTPVMYGEGMAPTPGIGWATSASIHTLRYHFKLVFNSSVFFRSLPGTVNGVYIDTSEWRLHRYQ